MKLYTISFMTLIAAICTIHSIHADEGYNFSFKNKSPRPVQIRLMQGITDVTKLIPVGVDEMHTENINLKAATKVYIHYCPDATWCKKLKPEVMGVIVTPHKPIHISFDGKTVRPQLKRFKNIGLGDIKVIKKAN